ncbi:MAG TPA: mycothiol system anti-sigma-R factor [Deltaproteobacteria bacterium]|jgi:mycothiol system anti-sigma-R factor|nr:mycothiol system anti-sigma-R factor [Deltaproteobacteria bacterium]
MNCTEAVEKLWQYLDRELDSDTVAEIERHLQECRDCFSKAEFERHLRLILRRSCGCEQAPPELRARLHRLLGMF